ncbi:PaaI family thioesterase [Cohnella zeiphila]|uniref:PaaI family thioesterase n=1 Tax=Cohnella zeiphila TaxID=2761120 RepID=A0A7X0SNK9_9BACL|nr:PaaI family thioesterase [Cohnella zeiphila]MBB6733136.1 PaaI family thioesterase [Cohnella zeiphila]
MENKTLEPLADSDSAELAEKIKRWEENGSKLFWGHLGLRMEEWSDRGVTISVDIRPELLNLGGLLHGGVHASLIDTAIGMLIMIVRGEEDIVTTNLNMHYLASRSEGRVFAAAEIVHQSRKSITAQGFVRSEDGERLAFGTATFRIVGPRPQA